MRAIGPGKQLIDFAVWVTVDDPGERVSQEGKGIDVVQLTSFYQGCDDGPVLGAAVGASEQCIFPVECDRTDRALDGV